MAETGKATRERVILTDLGPFQSDGSTSEMAAWMDFPSADKLLRHANQEIQDDAVEWQAHGRLTLLQKYGYLQNLDLSKPSWIETVQTTWHKVVTASLENKEGPNDLTDLIQTCQSNQRPLKWAIMDVAPGCQFQLHAHPNVELVYCLGGSLHEIRMEGSPLTTTFEPMEKGDTSNTNVRGPSISDVHRPWKFGTVSEGSWLVNEVGSIHKSFTATNEDGCILLCLWGGSHANITEEPSLVTDAIDTMEERLCQCRRGDIITQTFLPESERRSV